MLKFYLNKSTIMRVISLIVIAVAFIACDSTSGDTELTSYEKLQGTWKVSTATIDGSGYEVTNPGLGQMRAIFDEDNFMYVYPEINAQGQLTGGTDTLAGKWQINEENTAITILDESGSVTLMLWTVDELLVGTLSTTYQAQAAFGTGTSTYEMTYNLEI